MRYYRLPPDARLRSWIHCYWLVVPDTSTQRTSTEAKPDLLIPDGHSELVFRLAGEFTRWHLDEPGRRARMRSSYLIGGRSRSVLTHTPGGFHAAGVKLDPRALRALLRAPLTGFRDDTVECAALEARALLELEDRIGNLSCVDELPTLLDRFFLERLPREPQDDATTESLLDAIRATRGALPILKWVREQKLDARTVERRFIARVGMTPKQFARVVRFKHAWQAFRTPASRAAGAHLEAYYDQSHFDREFRHFLGTSPVTWLRRKPGFTTLIGDHLLEGERSTSANVNSRDALRGSTAAGARARDA